MNSIARKSKMKRKRRLSDQQIQAVSLLIQGCWDKVVADRVGVSTSTVHRWKRDNLFREELNLQREKILETVREKQIGLMFKALDVVEESICEYHDSKVALKFLADINRVLMTKNVILESAKKDEI